MIWKMPVRCNGEKITQAHSPIITIAQDPNYTLYTRPSYYLSQLTSNVMDLFHWVSLTFSTEVGWVPHMSPHDHLVSNRRLMGANLSHHTCTQLEAMGSRVEFFLHDFDFSSPWFANKTEAQISLPPYLRLLEAPTNWKEAQRLIFS